MTYEYQNDSPLSITSSIAGILTFVVAISVALYARLKYLRDADTEYFQVKASLSWYKTESTWMHDLITTQNGVNSQMGSTSHPSSTESKKENNTPNSSTSTLPQQRSAIPQEMYLFVMDQLLKLEERILELLTEAEVRAEQSANDSERGWTIVPRRFQGRTDIAMSWVLVRAKALELVRQREALGSRVLFAQMSLVGSVVRDQEARARKREEVQKERLEKMEGVVLAQNEKLGKLEDLVYRVMHQNKISNMVREPVRDEPEIEQGNGNGDHNLHSYLRDVDRGTLKGAKNRNTNVAHEIE